MSKAAKSMFVFGIYMAALGLGLLVVPNTIAALFGFPGTDEPWIRLVGLLSLVLSFFYIQSARGEVEVFFRWTLVTRLAAFLLFPVLVVLDLAEPVLILTGLADLLGAIWTGWALRTGAGAL
jgi:ABC-type transport system involved in multi-copper enzyme maturation permease subunit